MESIKATKKINDVDKEATILVDLGENVEDAIAKFGGEVVYSNFKRAAVITAQAAMRRYMEDGKSQEEIQEKMASWKPGVALERVVDPVNALMAKFATMSEEEKEEILNKLRGA